MSINKFYDIPPEIRQRNFPASFKTLKVGGKPIAPNNYVVGELDIDYSDDKEGQTYINTIENGNTTLYGYVKMPYYERTNHNPIFGGVNRQVTTSAELDAAILASNDGDAIELMNSITYSMGESLTITASVRIYSNENNVSLISTLGAGSAAYFIDVYSEDFQFYNIGLYSNSTTPGAMIRFTTNCVNATVSDCFCSSNQATIASFAQSLFLYNNTFTPLGLQPMTLVILQNFSNQVQIKNNLFTGSQPIGFKSNTMAVYITNVALPCGGEIFFDNNDFGVDVEGQEMQTVLMCDGTPNGLDFYFSNNVIFTNSTVCSFDNQQFLGGLNNLQTVNNGVAITGDYENDFVGFFFLSSSTPGAGSYPPTFAKVRSFGNILPALGVNFPIILPVHTSTTENPVLTYSTEVFINPPSVFINPPLLAYISIDTSPGGASGVFTPMIENLNANNFNIFGISILSTSNLQAYGTSYISVINEMNMSGNNISNIGLCSALEIRGDKLLPNTPGGNITLGKTLVPDNNLIEIGEPFNRFMAIFAEGLWANSIGSATTTDVQVANDLIPQVPAIKVGTTANPFDEIVGDTVTTDNLQAVTGTDLTLYSDILPAIQGTINIGNNGQRLNNLYADYTYLTLLSSTNPYIETNKSLVPSTIALSLGLNGDSWYNLYCTNIYTERLYTNGADIELHADIIPLPDSTHKLGNSNNKFSQIFTDETQSDAVKCNTIEAITGAITFNNSIAPNTTNTKDIGSSSFRWNDIFCNRVRTDIIDGLTTTNVTLQGNLIPDINNSRTLGSASIVYTSVATRVVSSDVTIIFRPANNSNREFQMADTYFRAKQDNVQSLGLSGTKFSIAYITNGVVTGSSRHTKKDVIDCKMGLEFINKLQPKMYRYIQDEDDEPLRCGLIYEDLKQVVQESGMSFRGLHETTEEIEDEEGNGTGEFKEHHAIHYESLVAPLIKAVKELKAQNDELRKRVEILEAK